MDDLTHWSWAHHDLQLSFSLSQGEVATYVSILYKDALGWLFTVIMHLDTDHRLSKMLYGITCVRWNLL